MSKDDWPKRDSMLNEPIDCCALLNQHEHLSKDMSQKIMRLPKHANTNHPEEITQIDNIWKKKQELKMQTHN